MGCKDCDEIIDKGNISYPIRVGNREIGYSAILIVGCQKHAKLVIDILRKYMQTKN